MDPAFPTDGYSIQSYRPRTEGLFAQIERGPPRPTVWRIGGRFRVTIS